MKKKSLFIGIIFLLIVIAISVFSIFCIIKSKVLKDNLITVSEKIKQDSSNVAMNADKNSPIVPKAEKKYDLLQESSLPLAVVAEYIKLPDDIQKIVRQKADEYQNIFALYKNNKDIVLIVQDSLADSYYKRHNLKKIVISTKDNHLEEFPIGIYSEDSESENDLWEYKKISGQKLPVKHTKYNNKKEIEYIEIWNYSPEECIKYEVKDAFDNPISVLKETQESDIGLRTEHIFYDNEGNTRLNISTSYDGNNIVRFTYYDAYNDYNNFTTINEYEDCLEIKESIYSSDYKLKNVYASKYSDGERKEITVYDSENNELEKFESK